MAELGIMNALSRIALAIDNGDEPALSAFFAPDAEMILITPDGTEHVRPAPLARTLVRAGEKYAGRLCHVVVSPAVELQGVGSAKSHSYTLYVSIRSGQLLGASETYDEWLLSEGSWKISGRRVRMLGELRVE